MSEDPSVERLSPGSDGRTESRPWGTFDVLLEGPDFKVKLITVLPGRRLSYQSHSRRLERWTVLSGTAGVTIEGERSELAPGETALIRTGARHRLDNPADSQLLILEVQLGTYFGEDDIVRYEDDYGRKDP